MDLVIFVVMPSVVQVACNYHRCSLMGLEKIYSIP